MNDVELKQELEKRKVQLRQTFESNIAAIDSTIQIIDQRIASPNPSPDSSKLRDLILLAIEKAPQYFSIVHVQRFFEVNYPNEFSETSIASSFWKIVRDELKYPIVTPGMGRRATTYAKIK